MSTTSSVPPAETILQLSTSVWSAQALWSAASLNVADFLAKGPKTPDTLAQETGTLARPLYRVLRALAALGIFAEQADGTFVNTPASEVLRTDVPLAPRLRRLRRATLAHRRIRRDPAFGSHGAAVRRACGRHEALGLLRKTSGGGSHLQRGDDGRRVGDVARRAGRVRLLRRAHAGRRRRRPRHAARDGARRQSVAARDSLRAAARAGRRACDVRGPRGRRSCDVRRRRFLPRGACGRRLHPSHIIHDWDDERSTAILRAIHRAAEPRARVLLIEQVVPSGNEFAFAKLLDLEMLTMAGGLERTQAEYRTLFESAGFRLERVLATQSSANVIEARKV